VLSRGLLFVECFKLPQGHLPLEFLRNILNHFYLPKI
jgi:hypothetical protein